MELSEKQQKTYLSKLGINNRQIPIRAEEGQIFCEYPGCVFLPVPASEGGDGKRCPLHRAGAIKEPLYRIANTAAVIRIAEMRKHPDAYTLENELALIRILLEQVMSKCESSHDMLIQSASLMELTDKIDKLLTSNIKLAEKTNQLLSVEQVTEIAQQLIEVIAFELDEQLPDRDNTALLASIATSFETVLSNGNA